MVVSPLALPRHPFLHPFSAFRRLFPIPNPCTCLLWIAFLCLAPGLVRASQDSVAVEENRARGAMLRSLALPGWGQFYNGKRWKGSVIALAQAGSATGYFIRREHLKNSPGRNYFLFSSIGIILYSMADAYVDAHLDRVDWAEIKAGVTPEGSAQMRLQIKLR